MTSNLPSQALAIMLRRELAPEAAQAFARRAEAAGFDELWVVEDCFFAGGITASALALSATERIRVGVGILPAVARNAAFLAMEIAALGRCYPGRFMAGIGHGVRAWMVQIGALPRSQMKALEETTQAVRALLRGETITLHGEHVHLDAVRLDHPPRVVPPVYLGVRGPKSLALVGREADGVILCEPAPTGYIAWARDQIGAAAAAVGRTEPLRTVIYAIYAVDADREAAYQRARPLAADILAFSEVEHQIAALAFADELRSRRAAGGAAALAAQMPDSWLDPVMIVGTPDDCAQSIRRLYAAGADSVVLMPAARDPDPFPALASITRALGR